MSAPLTVPLDRSLDGARVLWRLFLSPRAPVEGWIREFSADGALVRISRTSRPTDAGDWQRVYGVRIEAVLEPGRAPALREPPNLPSPTSKNSDGQTSFGDECEEDT